MDVTELALNIFDNCAAEYQNKFMDVSLYQTSLDLFCSYIGKEHAEILELACGPGNITRYLLQKHPDFKITGTDISPNMLSLARLNNPAATFKLMDCRAISDLTQMYDALICSFGLPYLSKEDALKLTGDAANILQPGGIIYLSTMEDDYSKSGFKGSTSDSSKQLFMHYHQADYLSDALTKNGFDILSLQRQNYPVLTGEPVVDLIIIAQKSRF